MDKREPFPWLIYCQYESLPLFRPGSVTKLLMYLPNGEKVNKRVGTGGVSGFWESRRGRDAEGSASLLD